VEVKVFELSKRANGVPFKARRIFRFYEKSGREEQAKRACFPRLTDGAVQIWFAMVKAGALVWGALLRVSTISCGSCSLSVRVASSQCCWTGTEESES